MKKKDFQKKIDLFLEDNEDDFFHLCEVKNSFDKYIGDKEIDFKNFIFVLFEQNLVKFAKLISDDIPLKPIERNELLKVLDQSNYWEKDLIVSYPSYFMKTKS